MKGIETDKNVGGKTPEEIKKSIEVLRFYAKGATDAYVTHLTYGGKADQEQEEYINALDDGADALDLIQQLEEALLLMVYQYCQEDDSHVSHRYMTAGEHAFAALGIENYCSIETISKRLDEMEGIHKTPLPEPPKEE